MTHTRFGQGLQKSYQKGIEMGTERALHLIPLRLGAKRFSAPTREIEATIRAIHDVARLEALTERILDAQSWDDLLGR